MAVLAGGSVGWVLLTRDTWVAADVGPVATVQPGAATNGALVRRPPRLSPVIILGHLARVTALPDGHAPRAATCSAVCRYEAEEAAACLGLDLVTTSAKEDVNIEHVFRTIANTHLRPGPALPARTSEPAVSWRHGRKQHGKERQRRLQLQLRRQQLQLEERRYLPAPAPAGPPQPRSVQRRGSRLVRGPGSVGSLGAEPGLTLEEMWEDPLGVQEVPLMLAPAPASRGHYSLVLRPQLGRESSVDSPRAEHLVRLHPVFCPEDQDLWHSNLFSSLAASASSPSLVQSPAPSSGSRTRDSGSRASEVTVEAAAPDSAAQFLASPMFDSLKSRRWGHLGHLGRCGVRGRSAKYSLAPGRGGEGLLANKCSIM